MKKAFFLICVTLGATLSVSAAGEAGADRILKEHRLAMLQWQQQLAAAPSAKAKAALIAEAPDSAAYGTRMMKEIGAELDKEWTLPYSTWLMLNHPDLQVKEVLHLLGTAEEEHMKSPDIGVFCVALVGAAEGDNSINPKTNASYQLGFLNEKVNFLEKVIKETPHKRVKGEASLALSVVLGKMGDAADLNQRRLNLLRIAFIEAIDSKVGEVTVGELAQEELYRMTKLSKGVTAPDLEGVDANGQPLKLSSYRGKVVMLVFWASWESGEQALEFLKNSAKQHEGKPFQIVGVNKDTRNNLKVLTDLDKTTGSNFSDPSEELFHIYRVGTSPWCVVLNQKGVIEYSGPLGSFADLTVDAVLAEKP